jgi:hypothetical protein
VLLKRRKERLSTGGTAVVYYTVAGTRPTANHQPKRRTAIILFYMHTQEFVLSLLHFPSFYFYNAIQKRRKKKRV